MTANSVTVYEQLNVINSRTMTALDTQKSIDTQSLPRRTIRNSQSAQCLSSYDDFGSDSRESILKGNGRNTISHLSGLRESLPRFSGHVHQGEHELQTHFAVYKFVPRHDNEVALNIGDAVNVRQVSDDLWCEGHNLNTGETGIFPSRYVSDILSNSGGKFAYDFSEKGVQFFLRFLGSVEVFELKGISVLSLAITKIMTKSKGSKPCEIRPCSLEIDYTGIRLVDHAQENEKRPTKSLVGKLFNNEQKVANAKFFFKLKHITFCGCYPESARYFGFISKHPHQQRFACHIFVSDYSTEPVAKAIGQAFRRLSSELRQDSPG